MWIEVRAFSLASVAHWQLCLFHDNIDPAQTALDLLRQPRQEASGKETTRLWCTHLANLESLSGPIIAKGYIEHECDIPQWLSSWQILALETSVAVLECPQSYDRQDHLVDDVGNGSQSGSRR